MAKLRPWLVIPIAGMLGAAAAFVATHDLVATLALALLGAALAAAVRAFGGPSLATAITAGAGALLGVIGVLGVLDGHDVAVRGLLGAAAAMFAICELARAQLPTASPWPVVGAALVAGALDPVYIALLPVAGVRLVSDPVSRPRWTFVVPIAGTLAAGLAAAASVSRGSLATLWIEWSGRAHHAGAIGPAIGRAGDLLGPLVATTALAGLASCMTRGRLAAAAVAGTIALTCLEAFGGGGVATGAAAPTIGPALPILAALGAGVAIGRLAAMIRAPIGQTCVGAAAGFVLVVVPAWALL